MILQQSVQLKALCTCPCPCTPRYCSTAAAHRWQARPVKCNKQQQLHRSSCRLRPCEAVNDPLQDAMYETWATEVDDWDTQEYSDEQLVSILYNDDSSPESVAQNVLAIALALLLAAAVGNVVWKIVVVSWALLSAAVRYVAVAFLLLAIAVFLA